jgi:hypothetical protein
MDIKFAKEILATGINPANGMKASAMDVQQAQQAVDSGGWMQGDKMQKDLKAIYDKKLADPTWEPANKGKMNQAELAAFNAAAAEAAQRSNAKGTGGQDALNAKAAYEQGSALKGVTEDYAKKVNNISTKGAPGIRGGHKAGPGVDLDEGFKGAGGIEADMGYDTTHRGKRLAENPKAAARAEKRQGKRDARAEKREAKKAEKANQNLIKGSQAAHPLEGNDEFGAWGEGPKPFGMTDN